ncbi:MAG: hypothetical protein WKF30_13345 [Pyrinomonadaceae bacterium]
MLRTETPDRAQTLGETLSALKQFAPILMSQLPAPQGKAARNTVEALQITNRSSEVELKLTVAQPDLTSLLNIL